MSFEALAKIRGVEPPGASALLLLFILAEYAGPDGCCYPSQATLSERSLLSVRAVRDNLRLLEEAGLIDQARRTRKNGERTSNLIRLLYYRPEQAADVAASLDERPARKPAAEFAACLDDDDEAQRQQDAGQPAAAAGLTSLEPVSEPITLPSKRVIEDGFAKFIATFPSKSDRADAAREFAAVVRGGVGIGELISAASRYAIEAHGREPRWVKKPANWLRGRCWEAGEPGSRPEPPQGCPRTGFAGPPELRQAVADSRGEAWACAWLDPCGWDAEKRELSPAGPTAHQRLREIEFRVLRPLGARVGQTKGTAQ